MSAQLINIVLDLETLSTKPNAAIIQIGAVVPEFDLVHLSGQPAEFESTIRYEDVLDEYRAAVVDREESTMEWWEKQPTRLEVFSGQDGYIEALDKFAEWIKSLGVPVAIWGNGADFDNVVLKHSLDHYGYNDLWEFRNNRCFRTLKNLFPLGQSDLDAVAHKNYKKHTALGDARYEADMLNKIVNRYGIRSLL